MAKDLLPAPKMRVALLTFALVAGSAEGACLQGHPTVPDEFRAARVVAVGKATAGIVLTADGGRTIKGERFDMTIAESFKGKPGHKLSIEIPRDASRFPVDIHSSYVLFVTRDATGRNVIDNCGNSRILDQGGQALRLQLRALAHGH
jgi:hypothetical protein